MTAKRGAPENNEQPHRHDLERARHALRAAREHAQTLATELDEALAALDHTDTASNTDGAPATKAPEQAAQAASNPHGQRATPAIANRKLTGPQRKIVDALRWLETTKIAKRASRAQLAFMAGYKPGGGAFNNTLGALRSAALVSYPSAGEVMLSDDGRRLARASDAPATSETLQSAVMATLNEPQRRVLIPLIKAWPRSVPIETLAHAAGYQAGGGTFNNIRGRLRSLGLIEYPSPGHAVARPILFVDNRAA